VTRAVRWCVWTGAAILAVALAGFVAFAVLGADALRPTLARALSEALERRVAIDGSLSLGWNGGPALAAEGVSVAGADGEAPLVEASRISVRLSGDALVRGDIVIAHVGLDDVVIRPASLDAPGKAETGKEPEAAAAGTPVDLSMLAGDITVVLTRVTIEGEQETPSLGIGTLRLETTASGITHLGATVTWGGADWNLELTGAALETLLAGNSWPVELSVRQGDSKASASGVLKDLTTAPSANLSLQAGGGNLDALLTPLGLASGIEDTWWLSAHVTADATALSLSELQLAVGDLEVQGDLQAGLAVSPPALSGRLDLSSLPQGGKDDATDEAELLDIAVPYHLLESIDLDLAVAVARHDAGGLTLSDIALPLHLEEGELTIAPFTALVDDERLEGSLHASARNTSIAAGLEADRVPLANLLRRWRPDLTLFGEAGRVTLDAHAGGATVRELLASLKLDLKGEDMVLSARWEDGSASHAEIASFAVSAGTERYLTAHADGTLDGNPASLFLTSGSLRDLVAGTDGWPIEFHVGNQEMGVDLTGVVMHPDSFSGLRLEGLLRASSFTPIDNLLDIDVPVAGRVEGYFHISDTDRGLRLDWIDATVGDSSLEGSLDIALDVPDVAISGALSGPSLVLALGGGDGGADIDAPLLEQGDLDGVALDIALDIGRLGIDPLHFDALKTRLLLAEGVLRLEEGQTTLFGSHTSLALAIDAAQASPGLVARLAAEDVDPRNIGDDLGLQGLLTGHIDRIALKLDSRGTTLRGHAETASAELGMEGGTLQIGSDAMGLEFVRMELRAEPDTPIFGSEDLVLGGVPIALSLSFVPLVDLIATPPPWTLDGRGSLLGLDFEISRIITPSLQIYARPVTMRLRSEDLRTALAEFGIAMPQALPLATEGTVQVFEDHVAFQLDRTRFAGSDLSGSLQLSLDSAPAKVTARFLSEVVAVDDFLDPVAAPAQTLAEEERSIEDLLATALPAWTTPEVALNLRLDARQVLWSGNVLEDVGTRIHILGDTLYIDEMEARVFGGSVAGTISLQPRGPRTRLTAELAVEHIDSDKLLRETGIAEAASGELALVLGIDALGATGEEMLGALDGYMTLKRGEGWLKSGAVEVLTKNILSALLSSLFNPAEETTIRCIIANADFASGVGTLRDSAIALENVVIVARGGLDLGARTIDIELDPKAIDWSFLRLLTPVYVEGDLLDPTVSPHSGEVLAGLGAALFGAGPIFAGDLDALCAGT
jgi:uncharacterized protein involved in outer membrane biogenesis